MADIVLHLRPELVKRLKDIAHRENRPVDDVVESLLTQYDPAESNGNETMPTNPLLLMLQMAEADQTVEWHGETDVSERTKDVLNAEFPDYLLTRMKRAESPENEQNPDR